MESDFEPLETPRISDNLVHLLVPTTCRGCGKPHDDPDRDYCFLCTLAGRARE